LVALLVLVFLTGGSARDDILSLAILRPLSVLFFTAAVVLAWGTGMLRNYRILLVLAFALPALALLHLIPLPPALWSSLPGRELAWNVAEATGLAQPWRPLSLVPWRTWNSFWASFAPLAALLLTLCAGRERLHVLVLLLGGIIIVSGLVGLLQIIGAPGNAFYIYRVTNEDAAVGLLANRNHQAMLLTLAFPIFAAAASVQRGSRESAKPRRQFAIAMSILIIPFILVTGSRAGILLSIVGMATALFVYQDPTAYTQARRQAPRLGLRIAVVGGLIAAMVITTALVARSSSFTRLFKDAQATELRFNILQPLLDLVAQYFPFGSGLGTFVEVYKVVEPDRLLSPRYLNHAHNDWLELLITAGLPGAILIGAAAWFLGRAFVRVVRDQNKRPSFEHVTARLGAAIVLILAIGSVYDYPLRTPSLACLFAVAVAWLSGWRPDAERA
jgi:O-antigen ligase